MARCCRLPFVKILEIAFTMSCLTLHVMSLKPADVDHFWLLSVTFVGMMIVELGGAFAECIKTPLPSHVDVLYSVVGSCLFLASGVACLRFWDDEPRELIIVRYGMWKGVLSCVTSVLFVIDAFRALNGSEICAGQPYLH
ncbi:Hypothetical predicted protein [Cloeon dipterum]|uniref:DUF7775 domain-containing protein n=1 Tax=Cloeon dipterum TaxID=197152 RepID=A0A8S1C764_9INSE|nr:Hypothetical predicted protein [Cloeon dipterum]